jgi:Mg2+ and Co2+ transporter CorA
MKTKKRIVKPISMVNRRLIGLICYQHMNNIMNRTIQELDLNEEETDELRDKIINNQYTIISDETLSSIYENLRKK